MSENYRNAETEIDLIGLFFYVLKKWRPIIIFFIIGAIIGCGVSYVKMKDKAPENLESYFAKLEEKDASKFNENNVQQYADYKALYESALELGENSVMLNMDQNNVYSSQLRYFISCRYEDIDAVGAYLNSLMYQDSNIDGLLTASDLDCTKNDIIELVSLGFGKIGLDNQIIGDANTISNRTGNLNVNITAPDEMTANKMTEYMEGLVTDAMTELEMTFDDLESMLLSAETTYGYSSTVENRKKDYLSSRQTILKNITELEKNMSDDEKFYYTYKYDEEAMAKYKNGFSKKWPVIVAIVAAFLAACWYAVVYIFDKHIKDEREIEDCYRVRVLGTVDNRSYKNPIDKLIYRWEQAGQTKANSMQYIISAVKSLDAEKIALSFDAGDAESRALAEKIAESDSRVSLAGDLVFDEASAETVKTCGSTLLITKLRSTTKDVFIKSLDICDRLERKVLGSIVIR